MAKHHRWHSYGKVLPDEGRKIEVKISEDKGRLFREDMPIPGTRFATFQKDESGTLSFLMLDNNLFLDFKNYTVTEWRYVDES